MDFTLLLPKNKCTLLSPLAGFWCIVMLQNIMWSAVYPELIACCMNCTTQGKSACTTISTAGHLHWLTPDRWLDTPCQHCAWTTSEALLDMSSRAQTRHWCAGKVPKLMYCSAAGTCEWTCWRDTRTRMAVRGPQVCGLLQHHVSTVSIRQQLPDCVFLLIVWLTTRNHKEADGERMCALAYHETLAIYRAGKRMMCCCTCACLPAYSQRPAASGHVTERYRNSPLCYSREKCPLSACDLKLWISESRDCGCRRTGGLSEGSHSWKCIHRKKIVRNEHSECWQWGADSSMLQQTLSRINYLLLYITIALLYCFISSLHFRSFYFLSLFSSASHWRTGPSLLCTFISYTL